VTKYQYDYAQLVTQGSDVDILESSVPELLSNVVITIGVLER